jgi:protein-disulfide isomerase
MENRNMNVDRWVEKRLNSLETVRGWRPDAAAALPRVWERDRVYRVRRRRWTWIAVAASLASLSVLAVPGRCDSPGSNSCGQPLAGRLWHEVFPKPVAPKGPAMALPAPIAAVPPAPPVTVAQNQASKRQTTPAAPVPTPFKQAGSPTAPILCEIYTDYECPACAELYRDVMPRLISEYVESGKVRLRHRDFPLPQHQYARLAARYANAAGTLGQYDLVVNHLFQTQSQWENDGSIDHQLAQVLAPGIMQKVRALVKNDAALDDSVAADHAMGVEDRINQTPTIIVVYKGKRQPIAGFPNYVLLKTYLDQLLAK